LPIAAVSRDEREQLRSLRQPRQRHLDAGRALGDRRRRKSGGRHGGSRRGEHPPSCYFRGVLHAHVTLPSIHPRIFRGAPIPWLPSPLRGEGLEFVARAQLDLSGTSLNSQITVSKY